MGERVGDLETILKYITHCEIYLALHDEYSRQVDTILAENELLANSLLDSPFSGEAERLAEESKEALRFADNMRRAALRKLHSLTGKDDLSTIRLSLVDVKTAFNKMAQFRGDSTADIIDELSSSLDILEERYNFALDYAINLIPETYSVG